MSTTATSIDPFGDDQRKTRSAQPVDALGAPKAKQTAAEQSNRVYEREKTKFTTNEKGEFESGSQQSFLRVKRQEERILRRAKKEAGKQVADAQRTQAASSPAITPPPTVKEAEPITAESGDFPDRSNERAGESGTSEEAGLNGEIRVNYDGVWANLPNPGAGEWILVHEGDTPYWKALTSC